ncbi:11100_t:CDS:1 [Acaulospora morrowiae]|uniref:11100_t:CDS:1 n=1 Tax=Acaulospora morrowiae TaxID=94023 RepID=A0A9N9G8J9_9GLOM|nr:11100_t:CDS:1 [Acaulospora morrowiae]
MKEELEIVIFSSKIQSLIESNYPNIVKLIKYNGEGLTKALHDIDGAVSARKAVTTFKVTQDGNNNFKTWSEYKDSIHKFLEQVNDDTRLEKARKSLAHQIWKAHYNRFPDWPPVGRTQSDDVDLSANDIHDDGQYTIAWMSEGKITVTDEHPSANVYKTKLGGTPVLRILFVNKRIVKELENKANVDFENAKKKVDSYTKSVGWD